MTVSIREQVLSAFETLLGTVSGAPTVYRGRRKPVPEDKLPALVMRCTPLPAEQLSAAVTRNLERITVTAFVKHGTDAGLDRALADLWASLQRVLEADPTLGGLAVDTTLTDADQGAAEEDGIGGLGEVFAALTVEYWTRPGDPYTAAP